MMVLNRGSKKEFTMSDIVSIGEMNRQTVYNNLRILLNLGLIIEKREEGFPPRRLISLTEKAWKEAAERSGTHVTPKVLRFWFANEMARLGVPDRFIDAFQGRIPRSVLARHYTDYSLENLKAIYDKAGLKVLP